jgi:Domain of unknown function (DUF6265)
MRASFVIAETRESMSSEQARSKGDRAEERSNHRECRSFFERRRYARRAAGRRETIVMFTPTRWFVSSIVLALVWLDMACAPARAPVRASAAAPSPASSGQAAASSGAPATPPGGASRLAWMEGRWVGSADGVDMEEHWTSPAGGSLIGMHKDVKGSGMTSFEFMRIEPTPYDGLVYFASPRWAAVTPFTLVEIGDKRAVFENKAHDFPQRILYWLDGAGALHARIEGTLKGSPASEEWSWTKK